jgi:stage II sporulation protein AB (anti-sigma F factor)
MVKLRNRMRLEFLSCPENVGLSRVAVAAFASMIDFNLNDLEEIKVAVSEAVSNAIIHGYEGAADGVVVVAAALYEDLLEIVVEDAGKGIADLEQAMQPGAGSDPERLGLGFVFMKQFMDDVDVSTGVGRGTRVRLVKTLPVSDGKGSAAPGRPPAGRVGHPDVNRLIDGDADGSPGAPGPWEQ